MEAITEGITSLITISKTVLTSLTTEPIYAVMLSVPFLGAGIGLVRKFLRR